jgi:hypothetical protein
MIDEMIRDADPVDVHHPEFDPDGPAAERALAAARRRRVPGRRLALLAGAVAAAAGLLASGGNAPLPAHAAMLQAAQRLADFSSGRVVTTGDYELVSTGYRRRFVADTRFSGDSVDMHRETDGDSLDVRQVAGTIYERHGQEPWRSGKGSMADDVPHEVEQQTSNRALLDTLAAADGATREQVAGGGELFRATVTTGSLESVPLPHALLPIARLEGDDEPLVITATVDAEGLLRAIEIRHDSAKAHLVWRTEYRELGRPQEIVAPR